MRLQRSPRECFIISRFNQCSEEYNGNKKLGRAVHIAHNFHYNHLYLAEYRTEGKR
jgi:hypothetical protein